MSKLKCGADNVSVFEPGNIALAATTVRRAMPTCFETFNIPEVLELILCQARQKDLLHPAQLVPKGFRVAVASSLRLQKGSSDSW
jgi:hypothetical protein